MAGAPAALEAALDGRPIQRPLRAPLLAALAAEVEELDLRQFLADAGKRSRILAGLASAIPLDVLVLDSGSGWDAEAAGLQTDWATGYPPALRPPTLGAEPRFDAERGGAPVIVDLLRRARAVVPDSISFGVTVTGPAALMAVAGRAGLTLAAATQVVLAAARTVAEAGAGVVIVREHGSQGVDAPTYTAATSPLWRSLRFFRSAGVLHVTGAADEWSAVLTAPGPFLPVFNARRSPGVAAAIAGAGRPYGIALSVDQADPADPPVAGPATAACALLTHDRDLAGRVPVRDARSTVAAMRA